MRVGFEALDDVEVSNGVREAVCRKVKEGVASSLFAGVDDLRLRLRRTKGVLVAVAIVSFAGGGLATSTATSARNDALEAVAGALDGIPAHLDRAQRSYRRAESAPSTDRHAAVRDQLRKLLDEESERRRASFAGVA
ncbi:MAG TPA: hypothetical protein VLT33_33630 [Labilithrix sp.]|nr:hypothetical protein [Labilithrix sp.]